MISYQSLLLSTIVLNDRESTLESCKSDNYFDIKMLLHVSMRKDGMTYQVRVIWGSLVVNKGFYLAFKHNAGV